MSVLHLAGCGDCLEGLPADCTPLYEPTFANVYANTIVPSCALAGGACHAPEGARGGLILGPTEPAALANLRDGRVEPSDAPCSLVMQRVARGEMPPGRPLSKAEQCAIQQWIDGGAGP